MTRTTPRRAIVIISALATAAMLSTAAPVWAQSGYPTRTGQLYAWISDGWGGGTVTSRPPGINCHQSAWNPDGTTPQQPPTGACSANFPSGTTVTLTATPDPGSFLNGDPDPNPVTVSPGYNSVWVMFCPENDLCSSW
ncbi:hypothetical protein [Alloactinosynnema sp. L-07]|uniref:hypothetical protein n=1 Tax=Alloactinosynnema sp. L-07 TaxID=1653480 RepID=UPI00065F0B81|nr:hypothetical protein [Alloactinosynnema sp. L-07]CRK57134.1 hypothetical protein [Alloactinosynnema sp. L-07]